MKRKIRSDAQGLYLSVGGWIIRPTSNTTVGSAGREVEVLGGLDPTSMSFGSVRYENGVRERWRIRDSETCEVRAARNCALLAREKNLTRVDEV